MTLLLSSINIEINNNRQITPPTHCLFSRPHFKINESDFFLDIRNVACYSVQNGKKIVVSPYPEADEDSINLYLEGSVLGAILNQRGILPFHGSSFNDNGKSIIICGHSGVGKSSVTAAFCQQGASFINDDITPVDVHQSQATILPVKTRIKLWDDTLDQLGITKGQLPRVRPGIDKFYLPMKTYGDTIPPLHQIFILSTHNKDEFIANDLKGMEKYNIIRHQIYRKIYLKGMPETEKKYFSQLLSITKHVKITSIKRPQKCDVNELYCFIKKQIES